MIKKVLVANRGEIAVRIIRACREMGIETVAVYSQADEEALHTQLADEAICIGPAPSSESYLNMEQIISATLVSGADAIHPGFGFLSENSKFVELCEKCNITFIGPSSEVIQKMGNKAQARSTMIEAGVPVIPGSKEAVRDVSHGAEIAEEIGYPVMIKAALGGGGKGMRVAETRETFAASFQTAQKEAQMAFGDGTMYLERFVRNPRHIEFQILADRQGHVIHLGDRDCSIQRRNQKLIEEAPARCLTPALRAKMGDAAVRAAQAVHYEGAGTVEFLLDADGTHFYFMEMNTRIQVENGVSARISKVKGQGDVDIIAEQIRIGLGEPLGYTQEDITFEGVGIEYRLIAEDPDNRFTPWVGRIDAFGWPSHPWLKKHTHVPTDESYEIPTEFDPNLALAIIWGENLEQAKERGMQFLDELTLQGENQSGELKSNVNFLRANTGRILRF